MAGEEHVRVQRLLARMAAAEPHRYVVVDADGSPDTVAARVVAGLVPVFPSLAGIEQPLSLAGFDDQPAVEPDARASR